MNYIKKNLDIVEAKPRRCVKMLVRRRFAALIRLLVNRCNKKQPLLDIGSRDGVLLDQLAKHGFTDRTGLDIWKHGILRTKRKGHKGIVANIETFQSDHRYGTVIMSHVLEHCPDPAAVLKNVDALLKPGGKVLIEVPVEKEINYKAGHYSCFPNLRALLTITPWKTVYKWQNQKKMRYLGQKL